MPTTVNLSDVFISYSRRNTAFARQLFDKLAADGITAWADWEDIPKGADWRDEINAGITGANAFLFIISPDSVASEECRKEIEQAVAARKRLVPVLHIPLAKADEGSIHPAISAHNWIFARETDDWPTAYKDIVRTLQTDLDYVREHTRILVRAREWDAKKRDNSAVLIGGEVNAAEEWLAGALTKDPRPTDLHVAYVRASRARATQRQRQVLLGVLAALAISVLLLIAAVFLGIQANNNANLAATNEGRAVANADLAATNEGRAVDSAATAEANYRLALTSEARANANADLAATNEGRAVDSAATAEANYQLALTSEARANVNADLAATNAAEALANANLAATNEGRAENNAATAVANAGTAVAAQQEAFDSQQRALSLALAAQSSVALNNDQIAGLALALNAAAIEPELPLVQKSLADAAYQSRAVQAVSLDSMSDELFADFARMLPEDRLLTANYDGVFSIWNVETLELLTEWKPLEDVSLSSIAVSDDGTIAAIGTQDGGVAVIDLTNGEVTAQWAASDYVVQAVALSPDASLLLTGDGNGRTDLWDVATQSSSWFFEADGASPVYDLAFSPDGALAMIGLFNGSIAFWDITNPETLIVGNAVHTTWVSGLAFSDDGLWAASGEASGQIYIWDLSSFGLAFELGGHANAIIDLEFSADTTTLISASRDRAMRVWDLATATTRATYTGHADWLLAAGYLDDGERAVSVGYDNLLIQWDLSDLPGNLSAALPMPAPVAEIVFGSANDRVYVAYTSESPALVNLETGEAEMTYTLPGWQPGEATVQNMTLSQDESLLAASTNTGLLFAWDTANGASLGSLTLLGQFVDDVAFSRDNTLLAVVSDSTYLEVINLITGEKILNYEGDGWLQQAEFHPNGTSIYITFFSGGILELDLATGETIRTFSDTADVHTDAIIAMAFNADGSRLLTGGVDNRLVLWDVETATALRVLTGHAQSISSATFTQDEQMLLSSSTDGSVLLWDIVSGEVIRSFNTPNVRVHAADLSPDNATIVTGGECLVNLEGQCDELLFVWRNDTIDELLAWIDENRYARELTCNERELYQIAPPCEDE